MIGDNAVLAHYADALSASLSIQRHCGILKSTSNIRGNMRAASMPATMQSMSPPCSLLPLPCSISAFPPPLPSSHHGTVWYVTYDLPSTTHPFTIIHRLTIRVLLPDSCQVAVYGAVLRQHSAERHARHILHQPILCAGGQHLHSACQLNRSGACTCTEASLNALSPLRLLMVGQLPPSTFHQHRCTPLLACMRMYNTHAHIFIYLVGCEFEVQVLSLEQPVHQAYHLEDELVLRMTRGGGSQFIAYHLHHFLSVAKLNH